MGFFLADKWPNLDRIGIYPCIRIDDETTKIDPDIVRTILQVGF